ncbi:hypothetical protein FDP41_005231 [Naegleria fowleri]|uniref:Protein kinase domain-containing protein n=1 Tax=Naegleria fowleri TaxID=5763 RepID=A0A6A5BP80_NAEFO|nr:uncharacterized protein FDP41_005231 [Naegleria fowleri]KAF0975904.1 hypothetical protein FDP41_005231 [Naegleria fowleri]
MARTSSPSFSLLPPSSLLYPPPPSSTHVPYTTSINPSLAHSVMNFHTNNNSSSSGNNGLVGVSALSSVPNYNNDSAGGYSSSSYHYNYPVNTTSSLANHHHHSSSMNGYPLSTPSLSSSLLSGQQFHMNDMMIMSPNQPSIPPPTTTHKQPYGQQQHPSTRTNTFQSNIKNNGDGHTNHLPLSCTLPTNSSQSMNTSFYSNIGNSVVVTEGKDTNPNYSSDNRNNISLLSSYNRNQESVMAPNYYLFSDHGPRNLDDPITPNYYQSNINNFQPTNHHLPMNTSLFQQNNQIERPGFYNQQPNISSNNNASSLMNHSFKGNSTHNIPFNNINYNSSSSFDPQNSSKLYPQKSSHSTDANSTHNNSSKNRPILRPKVINQRTDPQYLQMLKIPTSVVIDNSVSDSRKNTAVIKLSVNVLKTYKHINDVYYLKKEEERRLKQLKNGKTHSSKHKKISSSKTSLPYVSEAANVDLHRQNTNNPNFNNVTFPYRPTIQPYPEEDTSNLNNPNCSQKQSEISRQQPHTSFLSYSSFGNNQLYNYYTAMKNNYMDPTTIAAANMTQYNSSTVMTSNPQNVMTSQTLPSFTEQHTIQQQQQQHNSYKTVNDTMAPTSSVSSFYQQQQQQAQQNVNQPMTGVDDSQGNYIVQINELINNRFLVEEVMGKGSFGVVVKAFDIPNNEHVAVKIIKNKPQFHTQAHIEIQLLKDLNTKDANGKNNIVRMKEYFQWKNHLCIVFELLSMNLYDLLKASNFTGLSLFRICKFGKELLRTLSFLSLPEVQVIHCDLKPENILLKNPKKSSIKVIDFGSSCYVNNKMYKYIQSRFYRSPEVILGLPYGTEIDMWSFGCILVELHTGNPLFDGKNETDQIYKIIQVIGMPPRHMIEQSPKKDKFFKLNTLTHQYEPLDSSVIPNSVSLYNIIMNVPPKRHISPYSFTFEVPMNFMKLYMLVNKILQYDPHIRLKPQYAIQEDFFKISDIAHQAVLESPAFIHNGTTSPYLYSNITTAAVNTTLLSNSQSMVQPVSKQIMTGGGSSTNYNVPPMNSLRTSTYNGPTTTQLASQMYGINNYSLGYSNPLGHNNTANDQTSQHTFNL